jgi:NADH-quinone oxidoreductase subunit C
MKPQEIFDLLKKEFADSVIELTEDPTTDAFIKVDPAKILDIALSLRDNEQLCFDYLTNLGGFDAGEELGIVYNLYSLEKKHRITIKAMVPKVNPKIHTVERVWRSADWNEREAWDMFGIEFEEHHNLIRILCPYDWEGFPLRKDYVTPQEYHGMKIPYDGI